MQSLRIIRRRIRSVENTRKITRAMEMVAASKLKRVQQQLFLARPYFSHLENLKDRLLRACKIEHPLVNIKSENNTIACLVFTSDTGLCGSYNLNIIQHLEGFLREYNRENIRLALVGKKGISFFKRKNYHTILPPLEMGYFIKDKTAIIKIAKELMELILKAECKEVWLCYTQYVSMVSFKPIIDKLLPIIGIDFSDEKSGDIDQIEYILEPQLKKILDFLLPEFITQKLYQAFLNSFTCEQSARMIAMKSATDNAQDMIDELILLRNKVRQASITKELSEVVSTSEALK